MADETTGAIPDELERRYGLVRVEDFAKGIAIANGRTGPTGRDYAYSIEYEIFAAAWRGEVRLWREDSPYQFQLHGLEGVHNYLRLNPEDAEKLRTRFTQ
jgi:hypothetical protein